MRLPPMRRGTTTLLVLALWVLAAGGCATGGKQWSKAEIEAAYRSGVERFEAGDYRAALRRLTLVRDSRPEHERLHHYLGLCYAKLGMPRLAVESLRSAVKARPDDADAWLDLAVALELAGDLRAAERTYLELLGRRPGDSRAVLNVGLLYVRRLDDAAKGREYLERYLRMEPASPDAEELRRWIARAERSVEAAP
jgi:Flp pilus assembly protein TadD